MMFGVGIVSFILLALVYSSLTYAGATVSTVYDSTVQRPALLIGLIEQLLGSFGKVAMGDCRILCLLNNICWINYNLWSLFFNLNKWKIRIQKIVVVISRSFIPSITFRSGCLITISSSSTKRYLPNGHRLNLFINF